MTVPSYVIFGAEFAYKASERGDNLEMIRVKLARIFCEPHDFQPDPKCDLVDVCSKCGEQRA